jgi:hypothetical protein
MIDGVGAFAASIFQETTSPTSRVFIQEPVTAAAPRTPTVPISGVRVFFGKAGLHERLLRGDIRNEANLTLDHD